MQDILTAAEIAIDLVNEEDYGAAAPRLRIQRPWSWRLLTLGDSRKENGRPSPELRKPCSPKVRSMGGRPALVDDIGT
jgi:hypothetical protein